MTVKAVHAPELFTPRRVTRGYTPERAAYLRENSFVDPAILAADLGLSTLFVVTYLRKLGLRGCVRNREDG